ncbi:MAG: tetratricopeptide repeat protein [Planctomycetaceae bacterium]
MPAEKLADGECHVIGIYMPQSASEDDRVYVKVNATGKPMIVVLCGYFSAQWNLDIAPSADVRQIIVSGWFEQSLVGAAATIPTKFIIGSQSSKSPDKDYFWGYALETKEGRNVREKVKRLTGREVTTFQGLYQGKNFVIDGRLGRINREPQILALTSDQRQDRKLVEEHVRQLFELDVKQREERIARAEADLERIKTKLAKRKALAEQTIASQVEALMQTNAKTQESTVPNPTAEGWRLWQQSKWNEALPMFLAGVENAPKDAEAWNGLGWTRFHLRQWDAAIEAFDRTLELRPAHGGARNGRGRVLMILGRLDEAEADLLNATNDTIKEYRESQAVQKEVTAAWFGLVEVNLAQKDFATAKEWAERYLKLKPDDVQMKQLLEQASQ